MARPVTRLPRTLTCLLAVVVAVSAGGCTKVKPAPPESLSLATGRPSLSAQVSEPPSTGPQRGIEEASALASIGDSPLPTPDSGYSATSLQVPANPPTPTPEPRHITHTVGWGDTVLSIALQYGARMEAIVQANNLTNNVIYVGQVLTIPLPEIPIGAQQYVVQPGDTLYSIAQHLGVEVDALMRANGLTNGYYLQVGQVLIVPAGGTLPSPSNRVQAAGVNPRRTHVVQPGDSLSSLAVMYDVAAQDIALVNALENPNLLQVGQTLIIP